MSASGFAPLSLRGRLSRWDYWKYSLGLIIATTIIIYIVLFLLCFYLDHVDKPAPVATFGAASFVLSVLVGFLWLSAALQVKRLHDRGISGWFVLLTLVPVVGPIWLVFETYFRKGQQKENRYGAADHRERHLTSWAMIYFGLAIFLAGAAIAGGRLLIAEPFDISSAGNVPTLLSGDDLYVFKSVYFFREPRRGEMVAFVNRHTGEYWIKRVVGLGGDTVQLKEGIVIVNGVPASRSRVEDYEEQDWYPVYGRYSISKKYQYTEAFADRRAHRILGGIISKPEDSAPQDSTTAFNVPPGRVFVLGDNRDNSNDSRFELGTVPVGDLLGPVAFVFFSRDHDVQLAGIWRIPMMIRWRRFLLAIH